MALLLGGVFADKLPLLWSYLVLFAIAAASLAAMRATPDDRPQAKTLWRPHAPLVPAGIRIGFVIATLSVSLAYCVGRSSYAHSLIWAGTALTPASLARINRLAPHHHRGSTPS